MGDYYDGTKERNFTKALKHSEAAEDLLERADSYWSRNEAPKGDRAAMIGKAQVHATLALYYFGLCR